MRWPWEKRRPQEQPAAEAPLQVQQAQRFFEPLAGVRFDTFNPLYTGPGGDAVCASHAGRPVLLKIWAGLRRDPAEEAAVKQRLERQHPLGLEVLDWGYCDTPFLPADLGYAYSIQQFYGAPLEPGAGMPALRLVVEALCRLEADGVPTKQMHRLLFWLQDGTMKVDLVGLPYPSADRLRDIAQEAGRGLTLEPFTLPLPGAPPKWMWHFGHLAVELLGGEPPYGEGSEILFALMTNRGSLEMALPEHIDGPMAALLHELLALDCKQRPASFAEIRARLAETR